MSGSAAFEVFLVVKTRDVSWAVFMATSPPLGNIQWNLRFITLAVQPTVLIIVRFASLRSRELERTILLGGLRCHSQFGIPDQRKNLPAEAHHLVDLRPSGNNELADADLFVSEKSARDFFRRS